MGFRIDTISGRRKLPPRAEPYWYKLSMGEHLGFRKLTDGSGRWIARKIENRKSNYEALNCDSNMSFSEAQKIARKFFINSLGIEKPNYTVQDSIEDYIEHLSVENSVRSAKESKQRLAKHVSKSLGRTTITALTTVQVRAFRDSMVKKPDIGDDEFESGEKTRKSKDSANRVMNMFKAALNLAYRNSYVNSDAAWRRVTGFRNVSRCRDVFFSNDDINLLLNTSSEELKKLIELAIHTGARYGELRHARVSDFSSSNKTLKLSSIKTGARTAFLSDATVGILNSFTKLRHPTAFILVKSNGEPWGEKDHARPFKDVALAAKLPENSVFYCLRHYHISKALLARVSTQVIAENCGTSIKMIEKHYGKFMAEDRREMMNQIVLPAASTSST